MKLIDFKKGHRIEFDAPEGEAKPFIDVRLGDQEYAQKDEIIRAQILAREELPPDTELPNKFAIECDNRSSVGTYLIHWGNWEDDAGNPLVSRTQEGAIHEDNGFTVISVSEIKDALLFKVSELRREKTAVLEAARGNSPMPLPVN